LAEGLKSKQGCNRGSWGDHRVLGCTTWYHGIINGAVVLLRGQSERDWNDDEQAMLDAVAGHLAIAMRQITDHKELERLSTTDTLTGLMNRRAFQSDLETAIVRAERNEAPGVLLFIDLDNFKQINDSNGHEVGDNVLCDVSEMIRSRSRKYDLVARLGGDEFAVWLDNASLPLPIERADEIIAQISDLAENYSNDSTLLGASIGLAEFVPGLGESLREVLVRGDEAMYAAKRAGKNGWSTADKYNQQCDIENHDVTMVAMRRLLEPNGGGRSDDKRPA
jgi:diguanylate cyclase (GGDEF)-like protein